VTAAWLTALLVIALAAPVTVNAAGEPASLDASSLVLPPSDEAIVGLYGASGSYHLADAGPDMLLTKAGVEFLVITGRSLTGSSVIGRVEVNLATGEVTYHGNLVGSQPLDPNWYEPICEVLA
jgi:hypothetical protein